MKRIFALLMVIFATACGSPDDFTIATSGPDTEKWDLVFHCPSASCAAVTTDGIMATYPWEKLRIAYRSNASCSGPGQPDVVTLSSGVIRLHQNVGLCYWNSIQIGSNPANAQIAISYGSTGQMIFARRTNGSVYVSYSGYGFQKIIDSGVVDMVAVGDRLYTINSVKEISYWEWQNETWKLADNNYMSGGIAAGSFGLFQIHDAGSDHSIWRWDGCLRCWTRIDNHPNAWKIAVGSSRIYQMHNDTRQIFLGNSAGWWLQIDYNPASQGIVASGYYVWQIRTGGQVLYYDEANGWYDRGSGFKQIFSTSAVPNIL